MTAAASAVREIRSLKTLDPDKAALTNAVLRLLGDGSGQVIVATGDTRIGMDTENFNVFVVTDACAFVVQDDNGTSRLKDQNDIDAACDTLDAADSLLKYAEQRLGIALDPLAIAGVQASAFAMDAAVIVLLKSGGVQLHVALAADQQQTARWLSAAEAGQPAASDVPHSVVIEFEGVRLPIAAVAKIGGGDLLLLPSKAAAILGSALAHILHGGLIDLRASTYVVTDQLYEQKDHDMADDDAASPPVAADTENSAAGLMVPVTIRLPAQYFDGATLGALRPGSSLALAPMTQGLQVELLVGGRKIAGGEIVEMGDNFAVLIDERVSSASAVRSFNSAEDDPHQHVTGSEA